MSDIKLLDARGQGSITNSVHRSISTLFHCHFLAILLLTTFITTVRAEIPVEPEKASGMHLGVVTCAGNTCHGANAPLKDSRVQQNEFIIWHREDKHAKAYTVLFNDASKRIARNLGIKAAHTEKLCLDCHADNVPADRRGKRFQIDDGVGCEACHGGGEHYLGPHVSGTGTHAENVKLGLYPAEEPKARATLCLSCHLGDKDKLATHRILGAGHPRISFELDTFTHIQPMHFKIDKDYKERKGNWNGMRIWAVGQLLTVERFLELFQDPQYQAAAAMRPLLAEIRNTVLRRQFTAADMRAMAGELVQAGMRGDGNDYGAAEQAAMALGAITGALRTNGDLPPEKSARMEDALKEMDAVLKDEQGYDPDRMTKALKTVETLLR